MRLVETTSAEPGSFAPVRASSAHVIIRLPVRAHPPHTHTHVRRDVSVTRYSDIVDRQNVYTNQKEVSL